MGITYLQLAREQGGTRYGPLSGMIQLGSDQNQCQIAFNASLGVKPVHAILTEQGNGTYQIQATEHGASIFLVRPGNNAMIPVSGSGMVTNGDEIILGGPGGPRLRLYWQPMTSAPGMGGPPGGGFVGNQHLKPGVGGRLANEVKRQMEVHLVSRNPIARELYRFYAAARTGVWLQPYYIVGFAIGVFTFLGAIVVTCCSGGVAMMGLTP